MPLLIDVAIGVALAVVFDVASAGKVSCGSGNNKIKNAEVEDTPFNFLESKLNKVVLWCDEKGNPHHCSFGADGTKDSDRVNAVSPEIDHSQTCGTDNHFRCFCGKPTAKGEVTIRLERKTGFGHNNFFKGLGVAGY